ncbi:MAG: acyl carrier protein [Firmicutes bacterium]|nr:acyl carrier protein [Bacillota bacterium]
MNMKKIVEIINDVTGIDEEKILPQADLKMDLQIDSLDAVEIGMALEEEYSITIPQEELENFRTVTDIASFIARAVA